MADWSDGWWTSEDGLRLHYRDYAGDAAQPPILCIPGLTRNARDFEGVADRLKGDWRVICVDLRGRGESEYARDPMSYNPLVYVQDIRRLVEQLAVPRLIFFGTSLGGLVTMLFATVDKQRIAGALLNDVGPQVEEKGIEHIRSYVGKPQNWPTWLHAARALCEAQRDRHPDWDIDRWLVFAKRACRLTPQGRIVFDYDMRIAEPIRLPAPPVDLWPVYRAMHGIPSLLVHGELSDLLSPATIERMLIEVPQMEVVHVPRVGHAPTLEEPEAEAAIDRLLGRVLTASKVPEPS